MRLKPTHTSCTSANAQPSIPRDCGAEVATVPRCQKRTAENSKQAVTISPKFQ